MRKQTNTLSPSPKGFQTRTRTRTSEKLCPVYTNLSTTTTRLATLWSHWLFKKLLQHKSCVYHQDSRGLFTKNTFTLLSLQEPSEKFQQETTINTEQLSSLKHSLCQGVYITRWDRLGSVAGPVIQGTGRSEFEDGLKSGDFVSGYSYHRSVRTRLSDHTKQTKFQSQRPNDVETLVPSIWVQKWSNIGTVSTWMGDRLEWYPPPRKNADYSCWLPVLYHIVRNWSKFARAPH
jgi:hypothetical protein